MHAPSNSDKDDCQFSAVLTPHRSLSPRGFLIFMGVTSALCFGIGFMFMIIGAWPVMGFMGLDVALIYWAFRCNYKDAKLFETIHLTNDELELKRVDPKGNSQIWSFNPYWVKVDIKEHSSGSNTMQLTSHGQATEFGQFLSDEERREFSDVLRREIFRANNTLGSGQPV